MPGWMKHKLESRLPGEISITSDMQMTPPLFNLYAEYIMRNPGLDEAEAGIKTARRNINNLSYADDTLHYGRKRRRTKEPFDESERGE